MITWDERANEKAGTFLGAKAKGEEVPVHERIPAGSEASIAETTCPQEGRGPRVVAGQLHRIAPLHAAAGGKHGPHEPSRAPVRPRDVDRSTRHLRRAPPRIQRLEPDRFALIQRLRGLDVKGDSAIRKLQRARRPPHRRPRPLPEQHRRIWNRTKTGSEDLGDRRASYRAVRIAELAIERESRRGVELKRVVNRSRPFDFDLFVRVSNPFFFKKNIICVHF